MVSVPLRGAPSLFGAAENMSVELPVPDAALVIASQPAFDIAAHAQLGSLAVIPTDPVPPPTGIAWLVGEIENVHAGGGGGGGGGGAAACDTVNV